MLDIITRSVRVGLVFVIFSVLYTLFNVWWAGLLDVYPLLIGVYLMTFISVVPYIFVNISTAVRNRGDGRWIITVGLSLALLSSLIAAMVKLGNLRSSITPFVLNQLKFDSTLALSLALLGLASLVYLTSLIPEGKKLAKAVYFSIVEGDSDEEEVRSI
ncbi:hypothetical protein [Pyrobaculum aerophilum]|uniref:Uncharacterized protein n=2 Tax=Pyrobaculum aerophilum TaxID=13773 RepID=Q8ZTP6_PYRAE|nr:MULTISPECIES: hypothetical protein [Pyrobaculum]AAL64713.1 hypothetical protein PAE3156 [Pyrobaculum aerophilum str. IM2]MCX8136568.1 hypothetical protein [Pyrobaculum aerophilum]HII46232.1 hypothetical protein [Pyrobaculum aerophilum]